ncbi:cyclic nucleotide-gated channel beta-1-like [Heptranchias perlo]|uniref:cyclic nucleotide-gated channel beta-1-like n=1 Tax=Heptranchias perlo TaxID=212740 RepID=UPI00355A52EB
MEEGGLTDTEVQSGEAGAQDSKEDDGDATSSEGGGDRPEEGQIEGAQGSEPSGDSGGGGDGGEEEEEVQGEEEERAAPSLYLEILAEPANHTEDAEWAVSAMARGGDWIVDEVGQSEPSPDPKASEMDPSVDSGLAREGEGDGGPEDSEVTDRPAPSDSDAGVGQLRHPRCPTDKSDKESGTSPLDDCDAEAVGRLGRGLLPLDTGDINNMTKCLTPDFSDREVFFDLVCEVQSRRLNDQRCSFRKKVRDRWAYRSMPTSPLDEKRPFFPSMSSLQTEEFFDLIACSQSRRLDDQRADFEDSPVDELRSPFPEGNVEYLALVGRTASETETEDPATARGDSPTEGKEPPAEKEEVPAERGEDPAERGEDPAERGEDPAEKGEDPAEKGEDPAERGEDPAESDAIPAERGEDPAESDAIPAEEVKTPGRIKEPDDELYNTILNHQSASARIEDQRSHPPAYSSQEFFDLLERMQERRMDEQRASLPPGLAPKRALPERGREERRESIFSPLLKGMSNRRANSS